MIGGTKKKRMSMGFFDEFFDSMVIRPANET